MNQIQHVSAFQTMTLAGSNKRVAQQDDNENQLPQMGKGAAAGRKAETKYHMQVTAAVRLSNSAEEIKLKVSAFKQNLIF